jgi:hypothetical protein
MRCPAPGDASLPQELPSSLPDIVGMVELGPSCFAVLIYVIALVTAAGGCAAGDAVLRGADAAN